MTNEEMRIEIAIATRKWFGPFVAREWLRGWGPEGEDVYGHCVGTNSDGDRAEVPDYLNDLNAMHEVEKVLDGEQYERYCGNLFKQTAQWKCAVSATAAQRAEAFLKVIGKLSS